MKWRGFKIHSRLNVLIKMVNKAEKKLINLLAGAAMGGKRAPRKTQNRPKFIGPKQQPKKNNNKPQKNFPFFQANAVSAKTMKANASRKVGAGMRSMGVTQDGASFLKCAFAPPDFQSVDIRGFPDNFEGNSYVKKHKMVAPKALNATLDWYIILLPVPGYAYFEATVATGTAPTSTTVWTGVPYSDTANVFNPGGVAGNSTTSNFTKFRYISNHIELVPTVNALNWGGSILAFKSAVNVTPRSGGVAGNIFSIFGLEACNSTTANMYVAPFNLGIFAGCYNSGSSADFSLITEGATSMPVAVITASDWGQITSPQGYTGFDNNFEALFIKVSGQSASALNTCILKTWACVEYQVQANSPFIESITASPRDDAALALYRKIIKELPIGVSFLDNDGFWSRVLGIVKRMSAAGAFMPGPYGMVSGGINSVISGMESLFM